MKRLLLLLFMCSLFSVFSAGSEESPLILNEANSTYTIEHAGIKRSGQFFIPKNAASYGLVIVLHGMDSSADYVHTDAFDAAARKYDCIMLYPDAYNNSWDVNPEQPSGADDLGYIQKLIKKISNSYYIDQSRIFIAGHSFGGIMAYRAASQLSDIFAAAAPISAALAKPEIEGEQFKTSLFHIHAKNDRILPVTGLAFSHPITTGVEKWAEANSIKQTPVRIEGPRNSSGMSWQDTESGITVQYLLYPAGGHDWLPGVETLIMDFFNNHKSRSN